MTDYRNFLMPGFLPNSETTDEEEVTRTLGDLKKIFPVITLCDIVGCWGEVGLEPYALA